MELRLALDPRAEKPLQSQIFDQVRQMILDSGLKPATVLPSSRALAETLSVSRNTVLIAYDRLAAEGYIESRGTAGVFVTEIPPDDLLRIQTGDRAETNGPVPDGLTEPLLCFAGAPGGGGDRPELDFWVGRSDPSEFPLKVWRRIVNRLLSEQSDYLTDYCDPAGLPALREAIADHLRRTRGMAVTEDQIVVTTGGQDALNLVVSLLREHTQQLCIENPCYLGASMIFRSTGLEINPTPVDDEGIRVDLLPCTRGSLLYVTPSHQFPTGVMMSFARRIALLSWAEETDSYIVEDDYDSDFRYDGPPLSALAGIDRGRRVFYAGTFSKSVGAGIRLGFAVTPRMRWDEARFLKAQMSNGQSWLEQAALAEFIREDHFGRHVRKLRKVYKTRRDRLVQELRANFVDPKISGSEAGLHLIWRLPDTFPGAIEIQQKARQRGVGVYALSSGASFDFSGAEDRTIVLGFSSLDETKITRAVRMLREILSAADNKPGQR